MKKPWSCLRECWRVPLKRVLLARLMIVVGPKRESWWKVP
jgi:hypothetical protein